MVLLAGVCFSDSCHNENACVEREAGDLSVLLECVARLLLCVDVYVNRI